MHLLHFSASLPAPNQEKKSYQTNFQTNIRFRTINSKLIIVYDFFSYYTMIM